MFLFTTDPADEPGIKSKRPLPALPERNQFPAEQMLHLRWKTPGLLFVFKALFQDRKNTGSQLGFIKSMQYE